MHMPYKMEVIEDMDEGGYVVTFPDLPGCITCGDTIERAVENAKDAKQAWLDAVFEIENLDGEMEKPEKNPI